MGGVIDDIRESIRAHGQEPAEDDLAAIDQWSRLQKPVHAYLLGCAYKMLQEDDSDRAAERYFSLIEDILFDERRRC